MMYNKFVNLKQNIQSMKAVDVSCWKSPIGLILLTEGQKMHRFCVCAGQTVSIPVEQERSWVWVGVRGLEVRPHHSVQLYFRALCLFTLDAASIRPAGFVICFHYESESRSKVHSLQ